MPTFLILGHLTQQGIEHLKTWPEDVRQTFRDAEQQGVKLRGYYMTEGRYESVTRLLEALRAGQVVAVAVDGYRTASGRVERVHPVLAALAGAVGVPLLPVGIVGTFEALPQGAIFPRPRKIVVRVGNPIALSRRTRQDEASRIILEALAGLLPKHQQPLSHPTTCQIDS